MSATGTSVDDQVREDLVAAYGEDNVFTTEQVREQFEVQGFCAPFCTAVRRSDGARGTLQFCHNPRFYFNFLTD